MPKKYRQLDNGQDDSYSRQQKKHGGSGPLYKQKKPKKGSSLVMVKLSNPPIDVYSDGTHIRRPATGRMKQEITEMKRRKIQK